MLAAPRRARQARYAAQHRAPRGRLLACLRRPMPQRKHVVLIIHGTRSDQPALREMVARVRAAGHRVDPRVTFEPGDAAEFARRAAAGGVDAVVAVGGDGTVNEVVNGLTGYDVP